MKISTTLALFLNLTKAAFYETYDLKADPDTGAYFMELFWGTRSNPQELLIDTRAGGDAVAYDF